MKTKPRYRLELEAQSNDVPAAVRLRGLLKYALRVCGLRAVSVEEVPTDRPASAEVAAAGGMVGGIDNERN
jgi:hypothetical protein